jgi:hypothetical protein
MREGVAKVQVARFKVQGCPPVGQCRIVGFPHARCSRFNAPTDVQSHLRLWRRIPSASQVCGMNVANSISVDRREQRL